MDFGEDKVAWILQAEERALEQADPHQVQICIEMIESFTQRLKGELERQQEEAGNI